MTPPASGEQKNVHQAAAGRLRRELGTFGAVMMGLGAMVGTGVFVSIGIAAGIAGIAVVIAVVLAAGVALCTGLSSAQLAAAHPVSRGTYEYGYRYRDPCVSRPRVLDRANDLARGLGNHQDFSGAALPAGFPPLPRNARADKMPPCDFQRCSHSYRRLPPRKPSSPTSRAGYS